MKKYLRFFPFSWLDLLVSAAILAAAFSLCWLMRRMDESGGSSLVFVMATLLVSRLTDGFLFGLASSVLGVVFVNYFFTYPYEQLNFSLSGYPLIFATMLVVSVVTCALTAQVKQQEKLRLENEREKMRSNLLRSVSHDIRTPLTSIVGATSTVLENPSLGEAERRELLEDARDEAQWLIRVVENLLSITRVGDGADARLTKEPEAAEEVLGGAVRKFRRRFPDVSVQVEAPEDLLLVPMDPVLIEQVLSNLMENAVFHGKGLTRIQVSVRREGPWARFRVADDGGGIPPELVPSLLDGSFRQDDKSAGDKRRNMGLGLAVCTSIIRAHGGNMDVENVDGGADLSFRLPISEEEQNDDPG